MAIAVGAIVDDAIIDVENVFRRLKQNQDLSDRSPEKEPGHSPHHDGQEEPRQDQDNHDEPYGRNAETHTAESEAPVQGG